MKEYSRILSIRHLGGKNHGKVDKIKVPVGETRGAMELIRQHFAPAEVVHVMGAVTYSRMECVVTNMAEDEQFTIHVWES